MKNKQIDGFRQLWGRQSPNQGGKNRNQGEDHKAQIKKKLRHIYIYIGPFKKMFIVNKMF